MRKIFTISLRLILMVIVILGFGLINSFGQEVQDGVIQGIIRVKLKPEVVTSNYGITTQMKKSKLVTGIATLDKLSTTYSVTSMTRVFPYSPQFEERHMKHGLHLWYDIAYNAKAEPKAVLNSYEQLPEVDKSELIHMPVLVDGSGAPHYSNLSANEDPRPTTMPFNDPYLPKQWHYNNTGQSGGTQGADINLFNAWGITHGTPNVIISIHDQGVDYKHEDLKDMMWVNLAELNGTKGVDDDGNGYLDDIYGVNFADNTGNINIDYHGTHVAGTIAAKNNNGIGVCGVAGGSGNNDGVRIMTCQILGGSRGADIPASYVYAADMGAVISQNSWGYQTPGTRDEAVEVGIDYFIAEAGNYAGSPMKGGVVIFASGNSNTEEQMFPGAYEHVISVDALNSTSTRAPYSNYGTWTDISAPGGNTGDDIILGTAHNYSNGIMSTLNNNGYGYLDGTSMACPHVSGIAGLIVSKYGSPNFTNTELQAHLLTGVRYLYDIEDNKPLTGKLGSGYADAMLSLANDNKIVPNKTNDLVLTGIAQDFATLSWKVPADADDVKPLSFEILYSKVEITPEKLPYAKILTMSNIKAAGQTQTFEVTGLQAVTEYYFAIRSVDRWGNISEISNNIKTKTNSGPAASFDASKTAFNITIDVTKKTIGKDSVKLTNSGEGILRWDAIARQSSAVPLSKRPALQYPVIPGVLESKQGILSLDLSPALYNNIQRDTFVDKGYINTSVNLKVFGETNKKLPNSSATRFYVSEENGFNLTNTDAYLQWDSLTGPVIMEVYQGQNIANAQLLYAQELRKTQNGGGYTGATLSEQIYFEKGTYFWIVYHVPAGNLYPLGGGLELQTEDSKNCYYSSDGGNSWKLFEEIYYDNRVAWAVYATSLSENIDKYVVLNPDAGVVYSNHDTTIVASVDASQMINGTYKSKLVVNINETGKPMLRLPVNLTITGHKPVIASLKRVDFGGVIIGNSKDVQVTFNNNGLGRMNFKATLCSFSNPQFTYVSGSKTPFEAHTSQELTFRFTPAIAGNNYTSVTLLDVNGNNYTFELFGAGLEPPVGKISPLTSTFNNLNLGDSINNHIYISNKGKYPLDYYLPAFADGSNMETLPVDIQKFAYTYDIDSTGTTYVWNDISTTGTDITSTLVGSDSKNIYHKIQLNFLFPFYGKNENSVFISKYGVLAFIANNTIWSTQPMMYKATNTPDKYISGCGFPMLTAESGYGKIIYKQEADKLIVQYDHVPFWGGKLYINDPNDLNNSILVDAHLTFQIILYDNGNINMVYKESTLDILKAYTLIAMEDKTNNDGILISGKKNRDVNFNKMYGNFSFKAKSTIRIYSPGLGLFSDIANPYGTVFPGDSTRLNYTIKTDSLSLLSYHENLVVITNDPKNNPAVHTVNFNITAGGVSNVTADTNRFDYGTIFKGDVKANTFYVTNTGKAVDSIKTATFDNGFYKIIGNVPEILKPDRRIPYSISIITTAVGIMNDTLRLTTSNGQVIKIALAGEVIQGPIINMQTSTGTALTSITKFIAAGNSTSVNFKIKNTGAVNLEVAPVNNEWASTREADSTTNAYKYNYNYKLSREFGGPSYDWIEIADDGGTKIDSLDSWNGPEWSRPIKLPFKFNFYGNTYDTLYIGLNGIITFTKDQNDFNYFLGAGVPIPTKGQPDNYIAPLFLFGGPDWIVIYPKAGVYYKIEEDRIIIEFRDFNSAFTMGDPISYEAILYNNGNIKYQYVMPENTSNLVTNQGGIGIENIDGTDGVMISDHQLVVNENMSILLVPVRTFSIAPGESKDFIMNLSAKELVANSYADSIQFYNNDPLSKNKKLPVKLVVSGTPQIQKPDSVAFGHVMVDTLVSSITKEFEVKNSGTANFSVTSASQLLASSVKIEVYTKSGDNWIWSLIGTSGVFPYTITAKKSLKFRATIMPEIPFDLYDELQLTTTLAVPLQKVPITASIFNPAVIKVSQDTVSYYAQTPAFQTSHKIAASNLGGYNLKYNVNIEYKRDSILPASVQSTTGSSAGAYTLSHPVPAILPQTKSVSAGRITSIKSTETEFNNILVYDTATIAATNLGYGGARAINIATGFYAPATGFNLTHVQTWFRPADWLNSKIGVTIYAGDEDINNSKILWSETFDHTITAPDLKGSLLTFKLSQNVEFFPNEKFYIVFGYEAGVEYPQGVIDIKNDIPNRYLFGDGDAWYDMSTYSQFAQAGFMIRAAEETSVSKPWVIMSSADSGTIVPAGSDSLQLDFNAQTVKSGDNFAVLAFHSNDIKTPVKNVILHLRKNQGPVFELTKSGLVVKENDTLFFTVTATDIEGDNFTMVMDSTYKFLSIVPGKKSADVSTPKSESVNVRYTPDFASAGSRTFRFAATDEFGNKETASVTINVTNVNRPPVAVAVDTIKINPVSGYKILYPATIFTDPDNDIKTVSAVCDNSDVLTLYNSGNSYALMPLVNGKTHITFVAADAYGAVATNVVQVLVSDRLTGIEQESRGEFHVYPNPTTDFVLISIPGDMKGNLTATVMNMMGAVVKTEKYTHNDTSVKIDLSSLPSGIYLLKLADNTVIITSKIIKK